MSVRQPYPVFGGSSIAIGGSVVSGTSGSVLFVDSSGNLAQDNTNLNWNDSTDTLTIPILGLTNSTSYLGSSNDVRNWYLTGKTLSVTAQETVPVGLFFSSDGTKLYVIGSTGDDITVYTLGTAWDITTSSGVFETVSVAGQDIVPSDMYISPDGLKLYMVGSTADEVWEYDLSPAWVLTGMTPVTSIAVGQGETAPAGITFKPDGTKMYVTGTTIDSLLEYDLSPAWDLSTAAFLQSLSITAYETAPTGLAFNNDGSKLYVSGSTGDDITEFRLSTPYDISTATHWAESFTNYTETAVLGVYYNETLERAWVVGSTLDTVIEMATDKQMKIYSDSVVTDGQMYVGDRFEVGSTAYFNDGLKSNAAMTGTSLALTSTLSGVTTIANSSTHTLTRTALTTTSTDGFIATNTTAATSGVPVQVSPRIRLSGTVWDTASRVTSWIIENIPTSGVPASSRIAISNSFNAGAYAEYFSLSTLGLGVGTGATISAKIHAIATTEQLRLGYDASNYWSATVGSSGGLNLVGTGAGNDFSINTDDFIVDTSAGNIGIGVTPAYRLDVLSDAADTYLARFSQSQALALLQIRDTIATDITSKVGIDFRMNSTNQERSAWRIDGGWSDNTDATRTSFIEFVTNTSGSFATTMTLLGNSLGIGTPTPDALFHIVGTNASGGATDRYSTHTEITTAGTGSGRQWGEYFELLAGYTGTAQTASSRFENNAAGSGTTLGHAGFTGNGGISANTLGGGALNIGNHGFATGGTTANFGAVGLASQDTAGVEVVGIAGIADNTDASGTRIGVFGMIGSQSVTFNNLVSSAILADNGNSTDPIFVGQDNASTVFIIENGGNTGIKTSDPDRALEINDASGNNLRLTYNDSNGSAVNYADFLMSSSGDLTITPSGGDTNITGNLALGTGTLSLTGSIASTGSRVLKGWFTDLEVTNAIAGGVTGNAGTATALQNARTIGGVSFDGTANITVSTATGGFTVSGGDLALSTNSITMTGSLAATGARVTKGWFTDIESTNMPTVGGTAILTSLTAPQFTTIELSHASDNTLSASSGVLSIEGVAIPTISSTSTLTNKRITQRVVTTTDDATAVIDVATTDVYELSAVANATTFSFTGSPTDGQKFIIRYKDAGVSKGLTWTGFTAIGITLPTATTAGKWGYVGVTYNLAATQYQAIAVVTEA